MYFNGVRAMKEDNPLAYQIKKYSGQNPFKYSQARDFPLLKLNKEFTPTSKFWNRFNVSNEILIGTRGSGKTILLRMMSYSSLLSIRDSSFGNQYREKFPNDGVQYIGFYIPLRLRILSEIGNTNDEKEERRRFSFLFNCVSAGSIIDEIYAILNYKFPDETERLIKERKLINELKCAWELNLEKPTSSLRNLQEQIDRLFDNIRTDWDFKKDTHRFNSSLLEPIISILPILNNSLDFDKNNTTWIACFDEAEYLNKNLQRVLNTIMRSESRGLAVKIATLPFHYTEFRTEEDDKYVQPEGDDFRFESIDHSWDENDFIELTNYLVRVRLEGTNLFNDLPITKTLEHFVGESSGKDLISIYRNVFKTEDDTSLDKLVESELRLTAKSTTREFDTGQIKRYKPIYLLRELYKKSRSGNTKVPRLSGATMIRRVSDGNVRRFIQICDIIFEESRTRVLGINAQHDAVFSFSEQRFARSQSVYKEGFLLHQILSEISDYLFDKLHSGPISDVGIEFSLSKSILDNDKIKSAMEMGVAYSYFTCPESDLFYGISASTRFKLTNAIAAYKWLTMRSGSGIRISEKSNIFEFINYSSSKVKKTPPEPPINLELNFDD